MLCFFLVSSKNALHLQQSSLLYCKVKILDKFENDKETCQKLSTFYQQVIHIINIIHIFNNHNTKLSTLYHNLSTLQNVANTTTLYSYTHNHIKLYTLPHIVFNTTSIFRSALLVQNQSAIHHRYNVITLSYHQSLSVFYCILS